MAVLHTTWTLDPVLVALPDSGLEAVAGAVAVSTAGQAVCFCADLTQARVRR